MAVCLQCNLQQSTRLLLLLLLLKLLLFVDWWGMEGGVGRNHRLNVSGPGQCRIVKD